MTHVKRVLPHIAIVLGGAYLVFMILDQYNPTMKWVSNDVSSVVLALLCVVTIINGVLLALANRAQTARRSRTSHPDSRGSDDTERYHFPK